ncbi:MAG: RNA pyrophosphohydrolase [Gammaproteobacteria bacterium]
MIDAQGFRANVGIILLNDLGQVFWGRRIGMSAWQFPQGGVNPQESLQTAMYRELREEIGLLPNHVEIIGWTRRWLRYRLPKRFIRYDQKPLCIGQKQRWYVLRLTADETQVDLTNNVEPEFDRWQWINYWESLRLVVGFKRGVYYQALHELAPLVAEFGFANFLLTPE